MSHQRNPSSTSREPLRSIGAQDLLRLDYSYCGPLRKEGKLEREFQLLSLFRWRQYFVVLSNGAVYVYNDENSTSPKKSFSLSAFCRVERFEGGTKARNYCFRLINKYHLFGSRDHNFACCSDDRRKIWMEHFLLEMLKANNIDATNVDLNSYDDIEQTIEINGRFGSLPTTRHQEHQIRSCQSGDCRDGAAARPRVYTTLPTESKSSIMGKCHLGNKRDPIKRPQMENEATVKHYQNDKPKLKPKPAVHQTCQSPVGKFPSETEEGYITMEFSNNSSTVQPTTKEFRSENCQKFNMGLLKQNKFDDYRLSLHVYSSSSRSVSMETPSLPTDNLQSKPCVIKPVTGTFSQNLGGFVLYRDGFTKAEKLVGRKPEGSYLVVESKSGCEYVLLVATKSGVKQCPIYYEIKQWYVKKPAVFDSLHNLIEFYKCNKVPNIMTVLKDKADM